MQEAKSVLKVSSELGQDCNSRDKAEKDLSYSGALCSWSCNVASGETFMAFDE